MLMRASWSSSRVASVELRVTRWSIASSSILPSAALVFGPLRSGMWQLYRFRRVSRATFHRPFHALCGSRLAPCFRLLGHGYATEAARLALSYGFETLALSEIVFFVFAKNYRSRAVMDRIGLR